MNYDKFDYLEIVFYIVIGLLLVTTVFLVAFKIVTIVTVSWWAVLSSLLITTVLFSIIFFICIFILSRLDKR